jgi:nitrate reductase assembly molybdenum cofactor insertion protein NarJ
VEKAVTNPDFESYTDTFWTIIITMMTVGYGDIYPNTHFGRVVAFVAALIGMTIVSLLIIALSYTVEFSQEEKKAHNQIKKMMANEEMKKLAATLVKSMCKLYLLKKSSNYMKSRMYKSENYPMIYTYTKQLFVVKDISVHFYRFALIASTHSIPSEELLAQLDGKLENDSDTLGPIKYLLADLNDTHKRVSLKEMQINYAMVFLKEKQDNLINYLINFNSYSENNKDRNISEVDLK